MRQISAHLIKIRQGFIGFTLIELMLVIFIIGMMAGGVTMVSSADRLPKKISQEVRLLQASIRQMQSLAMIHQQIYGLAFNDGGWKLYAIVPGTDYMQWGVHLGQDNGEQQPDRFSGINNASDEDTDNQDIPWTKIKEKHNQHEISKRLELELFLGDKESESLDKDDFPQILFSAQGDVTPFLLLLRGVNSDVEVMLEVTHSGDVLRLDVEESS